MLKMRSKKQVNQKSGEKFDKQEDKMGMYINIILIMIVGNNLRKGGFLLNIMKMRFSDGGPELTSENAHQLIDKWVKNNKIVLFMKGNPESPRCGYSNFVVEILKKYGITDYKSIDILENNIIREQVKVYSKWPTYPQLYINGQLIGGSDILHEMHKDQSLQKLLEENELI